jgi:hypothetical protein
VKKTLALLVAASTATVTLAAATPALAYDKDAYAYAATHMLQSGDLPASLGDFGSNMSFNATQDGGKIYLCYIGEKQITAPGGKYSFGGFFIEKRKNADVNSLSQTVTQYSSAQKAISAFEKLTKAAKNCTGTTTQTWADDEDGSTQTSSSLTTNGKVPMVTEVGVESVFVNQNYLSTSSNNTERYANDTYTVYTLLNDVIIATAYNTGSLENIPTKQRKQINRVAFTAIDRWLD